MVKQSVDNPLKDKLMTQIRVSRELVPYDDAVVEMEIRVAQIARGEAPELIWFLEHPPLYTAGTGANETDLVDPERFPVHETGRGGQYTYHGPGQRIVYVMLDLNKRGRDVRAFVSLLEDWLIGTLAELGVTGEKRDGRVGVWVQRPDKSEGTEDKIAALGIRLRRWVSFHGISLNVNPNLSHYGGIVPCGISEHGITSLSDLGFDISMNHVDSVLIARFEQLFGPVEKELG